MSYTYPAEIAASARPVDRAKFVSNTYSHLAGALLAFVGLEYLLLHSPIPQAMMQLLGVGRFAWLLVLGMFMGVTWVSQRLAASESSRALQYSGLALYTVAEAFLFLPLIWIAKETQGTEIIAQAAAITLALVMGLTTIVFTTRKDFSFLGGIIKIACWVAFGCVIASALFGFTLGIFFSGAMVVVAAAAILYTTSNILHNYRTDQHVVASLALMSSVLTMFWYILRLLMSRRN
ncbi:MAG TPA: Bax inhibitor-1 family protein [Candidatus Limnocylindria bacterium]|jgi:FtsH-binding integral membrane protein|nr:Bax inhibitor-1 family protein [Candidatus Limnocylindria bacterium]